MPLNTRLELVSKARLKVRICDAGKIDRNGQAFQNQLLFQLAESISVPGNLNRPGFSRHLASSSYRNLKAYKWAYTAGSYRGRQERIARNKKARTGRASWGVSQTV